MKNLKEFLKVLGWYKILMLKGKSFLQLVYYWLGQLLSTLWVH